MDEVYGLSSTLLLFWPRSSNLYWVWSFMYPKLCILTFSSPHLCCHHKICPFCPCHHPFAYNHHLHLRRSVVQIPMLHYSIQSKITKDSDCYQALISSISNNLYKGEIFTILCEGYGMLAEHFIKIPRIQHHHQTTMYLQNIYRHLEYATQLSQTACIYIHIWHKNIGY